MGVAGRGTRQQALRVTAAKAPLETVALAPGFLFGVGLMRVVVSMLTTRVGFMACIEVLLVRLPGGHGGTVAVGGKTLHLQQPPSDESTL